MWNRPNGHRFQNPDEEVIVAGTQSQLRGKANPIAGNAKRAIGKMTRNRKLAAKWTVQALKGKAQDMSGRADRKLRRGANSL